jgi:excisionase family DNA binding protein
MLKAESIFKPVGDRPKKRLYSVEDAAEYLGRSVWGVREMLYAGKLPFIKDGRRILLDIRDMDDWIEKSKTSSVF